MSGTLEEMPEGLYNEIKDYQDAVLDLCENQDLIISKMQNILEREALNNVERELVIMKWWEDIVNKSGFSVGKVIE